MNRNLSDMRSRLALLVCWVLLCSVDFQLNAQEADSNLKWYRGNLHTHTLWSDGDDFPEMIVKRFAENGYHFLALTDHNILSVDNKKWMDVAKVEQRSGPNAMVNYQQAFGDQWVDLRMTEGEKPKQQVRLKSLNEIRERFESPGKFLLIQAEEISDRAEGKPIHLNATNLRTLIRPVGGATVVETINNNIRAVEEQAEKNGEPILLHLNHPNFGWAVTPQELAAVTRGRFFEVYNGHPSINHLGDKNRPGVEKMWDIANTIRIDQLKLPPILGLATDDSHHYHNRPGKSATMLRGWVMVRADSLEPNALINSMNAGDFYSSSGVSLSDVSVSREQIRIKIEPKAGVTYSTKYIGTLKSYERKTTRELEAGGKPVKSAKLNNEDVGKVLMESSDLETTYKFTGEELFVRAVVTSSEGHPNPSFKDQRTQAWTQPIIPGDQ